jgi:hypothetical protein
MRYNDHRKNNPESRCLARDQQTSDGSGQRRFPKSRVLSQQIIKVDREDCTNANNLVFSTGGQVLTIRAEADTSDVKVAILRQAGILQMLDLLTTLDIEDLSRTVATSGNESSITAETNTADYTLVGQVVDELNIQSATNTGVKNSVPIFTLALEVAGKSFDGQVDQLVAATTKLLNILLVLGQREGLLLLSDSRRRGRARHGGGTGVRVCVVLLRGAGNTGRTTSVGTGLARAGRGCRLGWCGTVSCRAGLVSSTTG